MSLTTVLGTRGGRERRQLFVFFNSGIEGVSESRFYPCVTALTIVVGISAGREHGQLFVFF